MRVALVHDYLKEYGGAERVLETLHEIFPDAPVFTTVYLPKYLGPHKERFEGSGKLGKSGKWDVRTSFLQYFPFKAKLISPFRLLSTFAFKSFNFSGYDVVITSATGAYFPNSIKIKNQKSKIKNATENSKVNNYTLDAKRYPLHICYCHTPPRYLYGYHTARNWKKNPVMRVLGETANYFLRKVDFNASKNVDFYIANSEEVASRIKKFYRRDATVIYPPVEINSKYQVSSSKYKNKQKIHNTKYLIHDTDYYLAGGRLARSKGTDIIVEAFKKLGLPLKIFGKGFGDYKHKFKNQFFDFAQDKNSNIEFLGEVSDEEKMELMRNAKAFIFASYDEDFGITPVEAMSVGAPVIAYKSGGVLETVLDGKTGLFYTLNDSNHLIEAVQKFETLKIDAQDCIKQANKFSKERFRESILEFINNLAI